MVLAAVYGPRAVQSRKEDPERMIIEVVCRPASGLRPSVAGQISPSQPPHVAIIDPRLRYDL